jgi:hypothetical protein
MLSDSRDWEEDVKDPAEFEQSYDAGGGGDDSRIEHEIPTDVEGRWRFEADFEIRVVHLPRGISSGWGAIIRQSYDAGGGGDDSRIEHEIADEDDGLHSPALSFQGG